MEGGHTKDRMVLLWRYEQLNGGALGKNGTRGVFS